MSEVQRIVDQLQRAWDGDAFHGPAVRSILEGVTAPHAFARPIAGGHSIGEIALHIGTWEDVVRRRLGGEVIDSLPDDQDWPTVREASASGWDATRRWLEECHTRLEATVAALPEARLREPVAARDYDVYVMLHGILQHGLYHAGQMALLKKAAEGDSR